MFVTVSLTAIIKTDLATTSCDTIDYNLSGQFWGPIRLCLDSPTARPNKLTWCDFKCTEKSLHQSLTHCIVWASRRRVQTPKKKLRNQFKWTLSGFCNTKLSKIQFWGQVRLCLDSPTARPNKLTWCDFKCAEKSPHQSLTRCIVWASRRRVQTPKKD